MMPPNDLDRYAPAPPRVTLESLDERVDNIERILMNMQDEQTPKWLRAGGWATIVGSILGIALKVVLGL
jgi:hypothetical protein